MLVVVLYMWIFFHRFVLIVLLFDVILYLFVVVLCVFFSIFALLYSHFVSPFQLLKRKGPVQ